MTKEMLFLIDVYTDWCKSQNLPRMSADDLLYSTDTQGKLTLNQKNWLETFIEMFGIALTKIHRRIMTQVVNLHFRLEVDSNQNIPNPVDLCRILNYNLNGKVLGYNVKFDDIIPFYDDDVEELNDKELDA